MRRLRNAKDRFVEFWSKKTEGFKKILCMRVAAYTAMMLSFKGMIHYCAIYYSIMGHNKNEIKKRLERQRDPTYIYGFLRGKKEVDRHGTETKDN